MRQKLAFFFGFLIILLFGVLFFVKPQQAFTRKLFVLPQRFFHRACSLPTKGSASCDVQVVTDSNNNPLVAPAPPSNAYGPAQFHTGYNLPCSPGGDIQSQCSTPSAFGPQTIGIVDAYNDPTVENDLNVYSSAYGIPSCTSANGCLKVVNQNGGSSLPSTNSSWGLEISLDVQIAHTICQTCKVLLVEANSSSITDLGTAVNTAASLGATSISNSYGASEWNGETSYDSYYNHPGVAVTASSGDSGYGTEYPASSQYVVAVGGTTLQLFTDNTYSGETVWSGTGSGCSLYEPANSWQTSLSNWNQTGCGTRRGVVDVAADADPNSGAAVYDSTPYSGSSGWWIVGGTSLASPLVASEYALGGGVSGNAGSALYSNYNLSNFHDITSGSNGNCAGIMCQGAVGYDGPTGLGSLNGLGVFGQVSTPTPTSSISPTPTATPTPTFTPTPTPIDTTPPTVSITTPKNGATVKMRSYVTISVNATDNVKVAKVVVKVANSSATATAAPYNFSWHVPYTFQNNFKYTITATAYDTSNNTKSTSVTVTAQQH